MLHSWRDECGVFGIWNDPEASKMTYLGLYALQHRGQESAGIVSLNEGKHLQHKGLGLVHDVFTSTILERLSGDTAMGHVRYSTTGGNQIENAQPLTAQLLTSPVAIAHNGNIVNAGVIRRHLKEEGAIFQGTNDTEVLLHLLAKHPSPDLLTCLKDSLPQLEGAYSLLILSKDQLVAARDPWGFRPLAVGKRKNERGETSYVFSSETCAFDLIGAQFIREVEPGEIVLVDSQGLQSARFSDKNHKQASCIFEHVYFARPDSVVFGSSVYQTRKNLGKLLAKESPADADIVIPVPDSGVPAALGYSEESGIPFEMGIIRNHYVGRTFIEPQQSIRSFGVKIKLNPQVAILSGKKVVVIDDSVVRGTTSQKIIQLIRSAGAKEVHLRISSPPTTGPCHYGVDTPQKEQLIASSHSVEQIREFIGADSLAYLSVDNLKKAVRAEGSGFCAACFDGKYPTQLYPS